MSDYLEDLLGIDRADPSQDHACRLVEADARLIDDLQDFRIRSGLTLEDVAERLGWSARAVQRFESITEDHTLSRLRRYCHAISAEISYSVSAANMEGEKQ